MQHVVSRCKYYAFAYVCNVYVCIYIYISAHVDIDIVAYIYNIFTLYSIYIYYVYVQLCDIICT